MKKLITVALLGLTIYGNAQQVSEDRKVENFTKINAKGVGTVYLSSGEQNVNVSCDNCNTKQLLTEVENGTLILSEEKKSSIKNGILRISAPSISEIKLIGAGDVISEDTLYFDDLGVEVVGAGDIKLILKSNNVATRVIGSGDIELTGRAIVHDIKVTGSGDVTAENLVTDVTTARISGAGDISVNATEELTVNVSGAGDVFYKTEPKKKTINIAGAGDVYTYRVDSTQSPPDTTKLKFKKRELWIIEQDDALNFECDTCDIFNDPEPYRHWAGFELGVNGLLNESNGFDMPEGYDFLELNYARSLNFNLNLLEKGVKIVGDNFKITSGFGFQFNHYTFDNNITLSKDSTPIYAYTDTLVKFDKNKLNVAYATIPLMFTFDSNPLSDNSFHLSAGVVAGYRIGTKYKQHFSIDDDKYKRKTKANYNLLPYNLSARASIGYGDFNIYATYSLTEFFNKNEGPVLHPFTLGIRLISF